MGGGEEFVKTMEASTGAGAFIVLVIIAFNVANASEKAKQSNGE